MVQEKGRELKVGGVLSQAEPKHMEQLSAEIQHKMHAI